VYVAVPGETKSSLLAAGTGCVADEALCYTLTNGTYEYTRLEAIVCPAANGLDAGAFPTPESLGNSVLVPTPNGPGGCVKAAGKTLSAGQLRKVEVPECRCGAASAQGVRAVDNCEFWNPVTLAWVPMPARVAALPGQYRGSSCVPMACGAIAGLGSPWPTAQCGPESL
jgi:hypothetical protein